VEQVIAPNAIGFRRDQFIAMLLHDREPLRVGLFEVNDFFRAQAFPANVSVALRIPVVTQMEQWVKAIISLRMATTKVCYLLQLMQVGA
jgi:hypothetical protein